MTPASDLDSRTWLMWAFAAMLPLLLGRNPWLTMEILIIVLVVRGTWLDRHAAQGNAWFLRIALVMAAIGVVFNVLTVHAGDLVFASLPDAWPVIGGDLTWNAVAYGLVSGLTLFGLVLTGITVAALIRWVDLFHLLPPRLAPIPMTSRATASGPRRWGVSPNERITNTSTNVPTISESRFELACLISGAVLKTASLAPGSSDSAWSKCVRYAAHARTAPRNAPMNSAAM